jgi:O-antigen/teichoic acid export membrane protein
MAPDVGDRGSQGEGRGEGLSRGELREATLSGIRWLTIARVSSELLLIVTTIVLARLISPAEFGRAAIALIVSALATSLASESFGTPLVQRPALPQEHVRTAVLLSIGVGFLLSVATLLLAPVVSDPLFGPDTANLVQLMAPMFLLSGLAVVPQALFQRDLNFQRIGSIEIAARLVAAPASVGLAIAGLDGEAIVLGALVSSAVSTVLLLTFGTRTAPGFDRAALRDITAFGIPAALSGMVRQANRNIDYAILGARLGAAQVGFYWRAFQFGVDYQSKISSIMLRIAFPVYSRSQNLDDMRALRARIVRFHATLIFPLLGTSIALAPVAIPWLLGERWEPAVLPTQILSVAGMTAAVMTGIGPLLLALGRPKVLLGWNIVSLVPYVLMIYFLAPMGITTVCIGVVGLRVATLLLYQWFLLQRLVGIPFRRLWDDVGPATVATLALLAVAFPLRAALDSAGAPVLVTLSVAAAAGGGVYLLSLRAFFGAAWGDVTMLADRLLPRRPRTGGGTPGPVAGAAAGTRS